MNLPCRLSTPAQAPTCFLGKVPRSLASFQRGAALEGEVLREVLEIAAVGASPRALASLNLPDRTTPLPAGRRLIGNQ
ncbi:hypothetical protein [Streptomyces sp. NPDC015350]|uniref:hypothetical protein n=1 Tax=Streptomyces sp. NPDC015350 TaxID=3364955 RepID=UPI0036F5C7D5